MKALLLHPDRDFDWTQEWPSQKQAFIQDLELEAVLRGMAGEDPFLFETCRKVLLSSLGNDPETIRYRQAVLNDGLRNAALMRQLYDLAVESTEMKEKNRSLSFFWRSPGGILYDSTECLGAFMSRLLKLRDMAETDAPKFSSPGFVGLFAMLRRELDDRFFSDLRNHLAELKFPRGVLLSAELGEGNIGANHVLRLSRKPRGNRFKRMFGKRPPAYSFRIAERDESGARSLSELRDRGINLVANALAQSTDHILSFFTMLRSELAFYIGCLNLRNRLADLNVATSFPRTAPPGAPVLHFEGLSDISLALAMKGNVVPNAVEATGKRLVIITGANQGGKTTFLRSVGLAHVMMQGGMFVAAKSFVADVCPTLFTHYKREEDVSMTSGKLDEELRRMSDIVDGLEPNSLLLLNESFASTNEREGSEIARQIVSALLEKHIKIFFVTHLYDFAHGFHERTRDDVLFLRAERRDDGVRTYKLVEGEPLETSYGEDLYRQVFDNGGPDGRSAAPPPE